ncbi:hypothetical protein [Coleofasciculus chthonoplastes]|jgi:hypothetical protein|uniref:hypothetical protein n=1 Tax=Coleofasciculus chthonoplastes TaxID=64178 RepID=UPI0040631132
MHVNRNLRNKIQLVEEFVGVRCRSTQPTIPNLIRMPLTGMLVGNAHPTVYQRFR